MADATMQLCLSWPDTRAPGRFVYRHRMAHDEFYTVFASTRAAADAVLRRRMRAPEQWELIEAAQFIPPSLRKVA